MVKASNWWRWLSIGGTSFRLIDKKFQQNISWIGKWEILFQSLNKFHSCAFERSLCDNVWIPELRWNVLSDLFCINLSRAKLSYNAKSYPFTILWRSSPIPCLCFQYTIYCGYMWKLLQHPFQLYCKSSNKFWRLIDQSFPKVEIISTLHATNQYDQ